MPRAQRLIDLYRQVAVKCLADWLTVILAAYAIVTLFLHKIAWLAPESNFDTVQLAVSKVLVFPTSPSSG